MLKRACCFNTMNISRVGNMSKGKYHDVLLCEGCGEAYIDSDGGCTKYCVECQNCDKMTAIEELDATLLLELDMEVCVACSAVWRQRYPVTAAKHPTREQLKLPEHVQIEDMGDHKGNRRNV